MLSYHGNVALTLLKDRRLTGLQQLAMRQFMKHTHAESTPYDFYQLAQAQLRAVCGIKCGSDDSSELFCSELVAEALKRAAINADCESKPTQIGHMWQQAKGVDARHMAPAHLLTELDIVIDNPIALKTHIDVDGLLVSTKELTRLPILRDGAWDAWCGQHDLAL